MGAFTPIINHLRLVPHIGVFFFVTNDNDEAEIGECLSIFEAYVHRLDPSYAPTIDPADWLHINVMRFMETVRTLTDVTTNGSQEFRALVSKSREYFAYFNAKCEEFGIAALPNWLHGIAITTDHPDARRVLLGVVRETIDHLSSFIAQYAPDLIASWEKCLRLPAASGLARDMHGVIDDHVPRAVLELRTEAMLPVIRPWFERSLAVSGDIAEFGCYKGTMSIKYAFYVRALGQSKSVYAFDTFEGFRIADPGGGALGVGSYADNDNAYEELRKWAKILPLVPVKGDATETCKVLTAPLSFVWLDLDMSVLMEPVLRHILNLCTAETILGVDDYGRPETPTIKPWADAAEQRGSWKKLREYPYAHIAFFRKSM